MSKRITAHPNHLFDAMDNQELAGILSEVFEPLMKDDDSHRALNELADGIQREIAYQYYEGVRRGRKVALEFLGDRFAEMAAKMPEGYQWFGWVKAFLVAGYQCCHTDEFLSEPYAFWFAVMAAYRRAEEGEAAYKRAEESEVARD